MMKTDVMRALIVDDEPLSRTRLRQLLRVEADIEIVGECTSGTEAIAAIKELAPDIVFLDVQMPELDGFQVLEKLSGDVAEMPLVIFVTAFDEYAVRAFDVLALDYVLKPVSPERLASACARARARTTSDVPNDRLMKLLAQLRDDGRVRGRLFVRANNKMIQLDPAQVKYLEAAGNYVKIHALPGTYMVRSPLAEMEAMLDAASFARIHRSTIVNLDHVKEFQPWFSGEMIVLMQDGTKLKLSRTYRQEFEARHRILS